MVQLSLKWICRPVTCWNRALANGPPVGSAGLHTQPWSQDARTLAPREPAARLVAIRNSVIALDRELRLVKPRIVGIRDGRVIGQPARDHGLILRAIDVHDLLRYVAEPVLRDDIAHKRVRYPGAVHLPQGRRVKNLTLDDVAPQRILAEQLSGQQLAEVAVQEGRNRHRGAVALAKRVVGHGVLLEGAEHKGAVLAVVD